MHMTQIFLCCLCEVLWVFVLNGILNSFFRFYSVEWGDIRRVSNWMVCPCIRFEFVLAMPQPCPVLTAMEWIFQQQLPDWLSPPSPLAPQPQPLTLTSLPSPPSPPSHRTPSPIPLVPHAVSPPTPPSQLPSPPPPPKFAPAHVPSPPLASGSDPLTPRTEQLLRLPLLDSRFDMGWSRYAFALRHHGQVQMWQRGQRLSRSHFLNRLCSGRGS